MKPPKFSIVIPSFNKVDYFEDTLKSIVDQKYPNLEVIVQDGGSTDGTLKLINKYQVKYPSIFKVESKKDNGQVDAINKGMKKVTGDILTYINADDVYEKDALINVAHAFQANPKALWFAGRGKVINEEGREIAKLATYYKNILLSVNSYKLLLITNYMMQPSVFITRQVYKKYGPFLGTRDFVTEYDLWLKLAKIRMPVIIKKTLSGFRIEKETMSMKMTSSILEEDENIMKKYTQNYMMMLIHKLHNKIRFIIGRLL